MLDKECKYDYKSFACLCPIRLGLAGGIVGGIANFILTLIALSSNYGKEWLIRTYGIYPGYDVTIGGALVGLVFGFIQGFIVLAAIAWIYDMFLCCERGRCDKNNGPYNKDDNSWSNKNKQ